jgi:tetratricopeptide (TPR) repeat protein
VRGIITYPLPNAVEDFKTAIRLNDGSYFPYYYMADHKIKIGEYTAAIGFCEHALKCAPSREDESQLYSWMGVCMAELGRPRSEAERLFRRAKEIDPNSEIATVNYERFLESFQNGVELPARRWEVEIGPPWEEETFVFERQKQTKWKELDRRRSLQNVLQPT